MLGLLLAAAAMGAEEHDAPIISLSLNRDIDNAPHVQHGSASQYADECCDGGACDAGGPCRPPAASAFDHHDGDISNFITKTYEIFVESAPGARPQQVSADTGRITEEEFTASLQPNVFRGGLVIRYDVSDATGNHAEQVTYAQIMRDTYPPDYLRPLSNERNYGGTTPFDVIMLADFKDAYDGSLITADLGLPNGDIHHLNAASAPFVISNGDYTCTETSITAIASDFSNIFGNHNLDNKATFHISYNLVDTTPPTVDILQVQITEIECNGVDHDIGPISGFHASDQSCTCSSSQTQVLVEGNAGEKCAYHCSGPFTKAVTFANNTVGSVRVTCVAIDYVNRVTSISSQQNFTIQDRTPPTLSLILHGTEEADAASEGQLQRISHTDSQNNKFIFNLTPRDDLSLTPQEALYITDLTIQHASGYFGDTAVFKDLEQAYRCSDTCTAELDLRMHSAWHVVHEPTECESLPAQTNWHLVDVANPGTFMIKYTCTDQSNNVESACRTIFNEGYATDMPTATPTATPTSIPTSAPTAVPTYMPCSPDAVHACDLVSTYCGMHEKGDGSRGIICACNLGYLPDPESETSCIATAAPTAAPTHAPSTSYPTSMPTVQIIFPDQTNESYVEFKLIHMPNTISYLDDVYDMVQSFIYFWAGDHISDVQKAVDHYELSLKWRQGSRRLRGEASSKTLEEELRPDGNFMGGVEVQSNGRTRRARRLEDTGERGKKERGKQERGNQEANEKVFNTAEFGEGYQEVCPVKVPDDPDRSWSVPVVLSGHSTQMKMKAHALTLGDDVCAGRNDNPHMPCEPRSSPYPFVLSIKMVLSKENNSETQMGGFCLRDTVTHILDSNGRKVPNFCGDICDFMGGECTKKTIEQYFNELKPKMLSDYFAGLICTTVPTAAPTTLPTEPMLPTVPVLNFINQCNTFGPCSTSNDASTCYCVAASLGSAYTDEGAVCSDTIEGDISGSVAVSGTQPDLSQIGTYQVTYACTTAAGGVAAPIVRTVTVFDAVCPTCEVTSLETATIEASFPYVDKQVICSDNMDLTPVPASTSGEVDVELTGQYIITYSATDDSHNTNFIRKYNNSVCNAGLSQTRTVVVIDSLVPVISLHHQMDAINEGYGEMQPVMEQASTDERIAIIALPFTVGAVALLVALRPRSKHFVIR
jgi:hypothetical protein